MANGEWATQRERRQTRDDARAADRRLKIEFADKLWLAENHPCADEVLAWLSENRAEGSKIGSSRWHLEVLPRLTECQAKLRKAAEFEQLLGRAEVHPQTLTVRDVLGSFPQVEPVENVKAPRTNKGRRQASRKGSSTKGAP